MKENYHTFTNRVPLNFMEPFNNCFVLFLFTTLNQFLVQSQRSHQPGFPEQHPAVFSEKALITVNYLNDVCRNTSERIPSRRFTLVFPKNVSLWTTNVCWSRRNKQRNPCWLKNKSTEHRFLISVNFIHPLNHDESSPHRFHFDHQSYKLGKMS